MRIRGAVLEQIGRRGPYADSRPISVGELELAPPGDSELLVRIEVAGLCHSDLSVVDGNREQTVPILLGHAAAAFARCRCCLVTRQQESWSWPGPPWRTYLSANASS